MNPVVPGVRVTLNYHSRGLDPKETEKRIVALHVPLHKAVRSSRIKLLRVPGCCRHFVVKKDWKILDPTKTVAALGIVNGDVLDLHYPNMVFPNIVSALHFYCLFRYWWSGWYQRTKVLSGPTFDRYPLDTAYLPKILHKWTMGTTPKQIVLPSQASVLTNVNGDKSFELVVTSNMSVPPQRRVFRACDGRLVPFHTSGGIPMWCGGLVFKLRAAPGTVISLWSAIVPDASAWKKEYTVLHLAEGYDDSFCCTQIKETDHIVRLVPTLVE